ncbi:MAG: YbbR-like domain-containing protein [Spirochaetales bacterium]|nr:YbbR-like domain-containing protein [Spirochaetales bacterium]
MKTKILKTILNNWPAKVLSFAAAVLLYFITGISTMEERFVTVGVQVLVPDGLTVYSSEFSRIPVTLRGNDEGIWTVREEDILLTADFTDAVDEGIFRKPLVIGRQGNATALESLEIIPDQGTIQVELQRVLAKTVRVNVDTRGIPAVGFQMGMISVIPEEVEISGPRTLVESLTTLSTKPVDLAGRDSNLVSPVEFASLDSRLEVQGGNQVEVRISIEEAVVLTTFTGVDILVLDTPPGLVLSQSLIPGDIRVQGAQLLLEQVRTDQVRLTVDAAEIDGPGTYRLRTRPEVPPGILILRYEPTEVEVDFIQRPNFSLSEAEDEND